MRTLPALVLSSTLGALLLAAPSAARGDEPGGTPPAPPKAPAEQAPGADRSVPRDPSAAWRDLQADPQRRQEVGARAKAYLAEWEARQREPEAKDLWALGMLLNAAQRGPEAARRFREAANLESLAKAQRFASAAAYATTMLQAANAGTLAGEPLAAAVRDVEGWVVLGEAAAKARLLDTLGALHIAVGRTDRAIATWVAAAEASNDRAYEMADRAVGAASDECRTIEACEGARARLAPVLARLRTLQEAALERARKVRDEEQDNSWKARRDQAFRTAERGVERVREADRLLGMLGKPAADWTLVRAYGRGTSTADYRGKVVVLDFWATWCPWCIRSFPMLRDLVRDYAGKDLEIVGVTTSSGNVFDQRYDLDIDLAAKDTGVKPKPVLSRPRAPEASDGSEGDPASTAEYERALAEYRAKEQDVIATFVANHEMSWDVVQIDEKEPGPKYLLRAWPHCVVLDREGRMRHFHNTGALLRENAKDVAKFRRVLDDLLAESPK
jgi:thiol-disulfide isomerase/thioredoxin